jgi:hypothetical protein
MNKTKRAAQVMLGTVICGLFLGSTVFAQRQEVPARVAFPKDVEIREETSPDYSEQSYPGASNTERWAQLMLEYDVQGGRDGWLDELTFNWYVLVLGGSTPRLLMSRTVTYLDVETQGETHHSIMYIRPETLKRYYSTRGRLGTRDVLVYVEVLVDNVRVGEYEYNKSRTPVPPRWWQFKEPEVNVLPYGLLSRDMTPFAPLDYDFYNFIKPSTTR